ncbi:nucleotide sugar dehydrogenase, partial [Candidatus Bathyarchaeota archaeon]|nr:nucleotide sugar dehydrogenase [Candidatus Bathyarchaeota archaeon]
MNIVVVGMGYVGIPVAALFADQPGFRVTGIQRRSERSGWKIDCINRGESPIGGNEPGLNELVNRVVNNGSLQVRDDFSACTNADAVILAVQTPVDEHKKPVYDSLIEAVEGVSENIVAGTLVSVESTLAPGTTINLVKPLLEEGSGLMAGVGFNLIYSYERVMAGSLLHNLINYPRIIGGYTQECAIRGFEFYKN